MTHKRSRILSFPVSCCGRLKAELCLQTCIKDLISSTHGCDFSWEKKLYEFNKDEVGLSDWTLI